VAELGTHEDLLARGGRYRALYETQMGPQAVGAANDRVMKE